MQAFIGFLLRPYISCGKYALDIKEFRSVIDPKGIIAINNKHSLQQPVRVYNIIDDI